MNTATKKKKKKKKKKASVNTYSLIFLGSSCGQAGELSKGERRESKGRVEGGEELGASGFNESSKEK